MLYRKIGRYIEEHLKSHSDKILIVDGARQVGKSFIIREVGSKIFKNFIEINFVSDDEGPRIFKNVRTCEAFYLSLSMVAGNKLGTAEDTLIFIDEIQQYPQFLTMLKFLRQEHRFTYIASGSMLGIALKETTSIPIGSVIRKKMYQLDFEEFLRANGFGQEAIDKIRENYISRKSLDEAVHEHVLGLFRRYLLVGGMPDAVNEYIASHNIMRIREIQEAIHTMYGDDATKYVEDTGRNLKIKRIFDMVPSQMENKKKRVVAKEISGKTGDRLNHYEDEFEYLASSGICLEVQAVTNPRFPLMESARKNLLKLYLNDVGMLTMQLYHNDIRPVLEDSGSINLGSVYENAIAQELQAHGHKLFYYDNRQHGEVDFLVDDYQNQSVLPIEVKSGKDYRIHSALDNLMSTKDYHINSGLVLSNNREVHLEGKILYMPVYYAMFIQDNPAPAMLTF
jgi:predicted AAA+ superfamily ATPase